VATDFLTNTPSAPAAPRVAPASSPLRSAHLVCDDFLPDDVAAAMRQDIDDHFDKPGTHLPETHQVWNYWHIPQLYTYLRTNCDKIIELTRVQQFMAALTDWSVRTLGMGYITWPYLSLYVGGCKQGIHNDSTNGRFAFVYSLTKNERQTSGGETIVLKEGDPFRSRLTRPGAGTTFYDRIAPKFNRLAVFDDRMPHAVERVEGSMDPVEGRFVLHGHISESGPIVQGPLAAAAVGACVDDGISGLLADIEARAERYHGPVVLRFDVLPSGDVADAGIILDRVARGDEMGKNAEAVAAELLDAVAKLKFPNAPAVSQATVPVIVGGPLPWMRR
jgi:2OG-Fe(II) oxygenase superfamily